MWRQKENVLKTYADDNGFDHLAKFESKGRNQNIEDVIC